MYMCVKLSFRDLDLDPYLPHPTSIYIYGMTTAPRVHSGHSICYLCIYFLVKNCLICFPLAK